MPPLGLFRRRVLPAASPPLLTRARIRTLQVNDYRKLQKRLGMQPGGAEGEAADAGGGAADEDAAAAETEDAAAPDEPRAAKQPRREKPARFNALEAAAAKQAAARAAAAGAAAAAAAQQQQREQQRAAAADARRRTADAMRKRNARGQPVMRYRVDAILAKLQAETGAPPLRR